MAVHATGIVIGGARKAYVQGRMFGVRLVRVVFVPAGYVAIDNGAGVSHAFMP